MWLKQSISLTGISAGKGFCRIQSGRISKVRLSEITSAVEVSYTYDAFAPLYDGYKMA